jgi:hypothetical protein
MCCILGSRGGDYFKRTVSWAVTPELRGATAQRAVVFIIKYNSLIKFVEKYVLSHNICYTVFYRTQYCLIWLTVKLLSNVVSTLSIIQRWCTTCNPPRKKKGRFSWRNVRCKYSLCFNADIPVFLLTITNNISVDYKERFTDKGQCGNVALWQKTFVHPRQRSWWSK